MNPAAPNGVQDDAGSALWVCPSSNDMLSSSEVAMSQPGPSDTTYAPVSLEAHKLKLEEHRIQLELARETVRLRELELQIASEKRKEREIELKLELVRWKAGGETGRAPVLSDNSSSGSTLHAQGLYRSAAGPHDSTLSAFGPPAPLIGLDDRPLGPQPASVHQPEFIDPQLIHSLSFESFFPASPGDADLQTFDNILRELLVNDPPYLPSAVMPSISGGMEMGTFGMMNVEEIQDDGEPVSHSETGDLQSPGNSSETMTSTTPLDTLSPAPEQTNTASEQLPRADSSCIAEIPASTPGASTSRTRSKKEVVSHLATCSRCSIPIAKLFLRGAPSELADEFTMHYLCERCASPVVGATGHARKRVKQTEDVSLPTICDVCLRGKGRGGIVPKQKGGTVRFEVEVVCLACTEKYKRCTDCGGGSGRLGVGKWRCKELFYEGRKTCNLSHARLGTGELHLAVWAVPGDVQQDPLISQVLEACEGLWRENVLRLAVPEILDSDQESPLGLRSYRDIQTKILERGWPAKDHIMKDEGEGKKKYLALIWAKPRARRSKGHVERKDPSVKDEDILFGNVRRTRIFYPAGCSLVGMWICNWDINRRIIHTSTTSPFDARDFEDQSMVSIAEIFDRVVTDGAAASLIPPSHWWMTYDIFHPSMLPRAEDVLIKRKCYFPLYEYTQRYPSVKEEDFVQPPYTRTVDACQWAAEKSDVEGKDKSIFTAAKFLDSSVNWVRIQKLTQRVVQKRRQQALMKKKRKKDVDEKPPYETDVAEQFAAGSTQNLS